MKYWFIYITVFIVSINMSFSQWTQTNGPYGKTNVLAIIPYDSLILVSTDCGYFSKNAIGNTWTLNSIPTFSGYTRIGDSLFIGGNEIRLIDLSNPNNPITSVNSIPLSVLSHSDSCLYGGNEATGFFKSSDFGITWTSAKNGLPVDSILNPWTVGYQYIWSVSCIDVTTNYIFCGTKKGIYRNTGNLGTWIAVNSGLPADTVTLIKSFDDTLFSAIEKNLYKSIDFGNSWTLLFTAPSNITSFLKTNSDYYLGTDSNGIYQSTNQGLIWNTLNSNLLDMHVTTVSFFESTLLCGTYSEGIFYYKNGQWISNRSGMICSYIRTITCVDSLVFSNDNDHVYMLNNIDQWTDITPNVTNDLFINLDKMGDSIFISNYYVLPNWPYIYQSIYYSTNFGALWNQISPLPYTSAGGDTWHKIYIRNGRIYGYSQEKMYFTDNLGVNWSNISLPVPYCNQFRDFIIANSYPFAAACGNGQVVKYDSTQQWLLSNNGLPSNREPKFLASCDSVLFAQIDVYGMYASFDNGNNWSFANNGLPTISYKKFQDFAEYNSNLFITTENGVFVTSDFGQNWYAINNGLKNLNSSAIKILNDTLFVGTYGNGIWKQAISDLALSFQDHQVPNEYIKAFPNPFSSHTTLSSISPFKLATLSLDNCLGQTVRQIKNISGHTISISRDNLPAGLYFIRLTESNKSYKARIIITD